MNRITPTHFVEFWNDAPNEPDIVCLSSTPRVISNLDFSIKLTDFYGQTTVAIAKIVYTDIPLEERLMKRRVAQYQYRCIAW